MSVFMPPPAADASCPPQPTLLLVQRWGPPGVAPPGKGAKGKGGPAADVAPPAGKVAGAPTSAKLAADIIAVVRSAELHQIGGVPAVIAVYEHVDYTRTRDANGCCSVSSFFFCCFFFCFFLFFSCFLFFMFTIVLFFFCSSRLAHDICFRLHCGQTGRCRAS